MAWVVSVRGAALDAILDVLLAVGADDVELEGDLALGLFHAADADAVGGAVRLELCRRRLEAQIAIAPAETLDWSSTWAPTLRPLRVGPLTIQPTREGPRGTDSSALWIEVGDAFGTGLHPTTRLCLDALVDFRPAGTVLDVGTGTGILALAALRLGADRAVGVDTDPAAVRVAARNAERAGLASRFVATGAIPPDLRADRVVANVLGASLIALAPVLSRALGSGAELSLSGFPVGQGDEVASAYVGLGLRVVARADREGWARLDLRAGW